MKRTPVAKRPGVYSYETRRGTRYVAVAMFNHKQRWLSGFTTAKLADEWREAEVVSMRQGTSGRAPARMTLRQFHDTKWWPAIKPTLKGEATVPTYEASLKHVLRVLGDYRLRSIDVEAIEAFKVAMFDDGVGPGAQHAAFMRLRQVLEYAVTLKWLAVNPAASIPAPTKPIHEAPLLSLRQIERLLDVASEDWRIGPMVLLALLTGLRWGELVRMQWADIDWTDGSLSILKGKTLASRKPIWFGERALDALRTLRQEQLRWAHEDGEEPPSLVFTTVEGKALNRRDFHRDTWNPIRIRAGLPGMHFHDLRHTAATLRAKAGVHPAVAQRGLRHAQVTTTLGIYTDVDGEQLREAANAVEALLQA